MKYKNLMLLFVFISFGLYSQRKDSIRTKDYFIEKLDGIKDDRLKLPILEELIDVLIKEDVKSIPFYSNYYVDTAIKLEEYTKAMNMCQSMAYYITVMLRSPNKSLSILEKLETFKFKVKDSTIVGEYYNAKANALKFMGNYEESIKNYGNSIKSYGKNDSLSIAKGIYQRGAVYGQSGFLPEANKDFILSSRYFEKLNEVEYFVRASAGIATIYGILGFHEKSIKERLKIIAKRKEHGISRRIFFEYYNLAVGYSKINDRKNEEKYLLIALEECLLERKELQQLLLMYSSLSKLYLDLDDMKKAEKYIKLMDDEAEKINNKERLTIEYHGVKQYYLFKAKRYDETISYIEGNLKKTNRRWNHFDIMKMNRLLYKTYLAKNDSKNALKHFTNYFKLNDSLKETKRTNALLYYQTLYETEKKEKEILTSQNEISLLNQKSRTKNIIILAILGISSILMIAILLFIKRKQLYKEKIREQQFSQKLLMTQETERKRISKDLHDSLGQSLLLVKNQLVLKNTEKSKELLNSSIEEMRTIAKILYPFELQRIGVSRSVENLIIQLNDSSKEVFIHGEVDELKDKLPVTYQVNIFRIVQECLSNVIKHANADSAKVSLKREGNEIIIKVQDNGKGFDFSSNLKNVQTIGLKTIKERVNFLKGVLTVKSRINFGSVFTVKIPVSI